MTPAVNVEFARKYAAAPAATPSTVNGMSVGGVCAPTAEYTVAARAVEIESWPKLKAALRTGLGFGVNAFTAAITTLTQRATPRPKRTNAAISMAKDIETALERNSMIGLRWATAARPRSRTNISGSTVATRTVSDAATRQAAPTTTIDQM